MAENGLFVNCYGCNDSREVKMKRLAKKYEDIYLNEKEEDFSTEHATN